MSKSTIVSAKSAPVINSKIVTAYQNITAQTRNLNGAGIDFILLIGGEMAGDKVSGREVRASIEQAGVNPLVQVKSSHAEVIPTACEILEVIGRDEVTVAKLLSLATRVKRSGYELEDGMTLDFLENGEGEDGVGRVPTIKEITDMKKIEAGVEEEVELVPANVTFEVLVDHVLLFMAGVSLADYTTTELQKLRSLMAKLNTVAKNTEKKSK